MKPISKESHAAYNVELSIDEIVLYGFAQRDRHAIREAIESELTRLLSELGIPSPMERTDGRSQEMARIDAGVFAVTMGTGGMRPDSIGRQVAQAVYKGMGEVGEGVKRPGNISGNTHQTER